MSGVHSKDTGGQEQGESKGELRRLKIEIQNTQQVFNIFEQYSHIHVYVYYHH